MYCSVCEKVINKYKKGSKFKLNRMDGGNKIHYPKRRVTIWIFLLIERVKIALRKKGVHILSVDCAMI